MKVSDEKPQFAKGKEAGTKSGATGWGHSSGGALTLDVNLGFQQEHPEESDVFPWCGR